uniref:Uncharacterized protein n=1 Tax=Rhinopithecus roxellana TaxID=61622 RepID=A0A2K6RR61_RHIRO
CPVPEFILFGLRLVKDTSCGIFGFGRLKSWQVQKVMRNTSSLVLKNISTLILSQVEGIVYWPHMEALL